MMMLKNCTYQYEYKVFCRTGSVFISCSIPLMALTLYKGSTIIPVVLDNSPQCPLH